MKTLIKSVALLLVVFMLGSAFMACGKKDDENQGNKTNETVASNEEVGFKVAPTNWGKDFTILAPAWSNYREYFFDDAESRDTGDPIDMALYNRTEKIRSHLGVTLKHNLQGTSYNDVKTSFETFKQVVNAGDDTYQLFLTHTLSNVPTLSTEGLVCDFRSFTDINLDADYWNKAAMEELEINSALYYGLSDYMISRPNAIFFNKTMQENYRVSDPYSMVRNGTWTLENMTLESKKVSISGDKATKELGYATPDDWYYLAMIDSCDTQIVVNDGGYRRVDMSASNERYAGVYEQLKDLFGADSTLVYKWKVVDEPDADKSITSGRVLFTPVCLDSASLYRKSEIKFGILPFPKYDVNQKNYRSFDFSGLMCLPVTIQNPQMVGQVLECLSYFSANGENDVHTAYYENLLGSKIADAPDDYEMLQTIFNGIVSNCAINFSEAAGTGLGLRKLIWSYDALATSYSRGNTVDGVATLWASHGKLAQDALDLTVNSKPAT